MEDNFKHPSEERKVRFRRNLVGSMTEDLKWVLMITVLSFFLSASLSFISSYILEGLTNVIALLVVLLIIIINIFFDIVGTSVTAADEAPFHAMASRKLYGAKRAILLIRNADKVSNFCNDVVGDICGVISGAATAFIIVRIVGIGVNADANLTGLVITGMVAALTVGGKALGKNIAIRNSNYIIYKVAVIMRFFSIHKKKTSKNQKNKTKGNS